jgi:hypothetical protein
VEGDLRKEISMCIKRLMETGLSGQPPPPGPASPQRMRTNARTAEARKGRGREEKVE